MLENDYHTMQLLIVLYIFRMIYIETNFVPWINPVTYIAEDNSHVWACGWDDMKDDISKENHSSCSNDIV